MGWPPTRWTQRGCTLGLRLAKSTGAVTVASLGSTCSVVSGGCRESPPSPREPNRLNFYGERRLRRLGLAVRLEVLVDCAERPSEARPDLSLPLVGADVSLLPCLRTLL